MKKSICSLVFAISILGLMPLTATASCSGLIWANYDGCMVQCSSDNCKTFCNDLYPNCAS